jgi:hypothetical protein
MIEVTTTPPLNYDSKDVEVVTPGLEVDENGNAFVNASLEIVVDGVSKVRILDAHGVAILLKFLKVVPK